MISSFFKEKESLLFDPNSQFVLFSGTGVNGNGPFRHLNDLFIVLYLLLKKNIRPENIYITIDKAILNHLNARTNHKKFQLLDNGTKTFYEIISALPEKNIIDVQSFEKDFNRKKTDLIFIASGHGSIQGLSIDNGINTSKFLSSDYFEDIADKKFRTILIMSQCQAAAFHHLDTRKNICVLGASDYQSSVSLPIIAMTNNAILADHLSFEQNIAINPFIFAFFIIMMNHENIIINKNKNIINLFKYVAATTLDFLSKTGHREIVIEKQKIVDMQGDYLKLRFDERILVQQPFLLNKILAARIKFT